MDQIKEVALKVAEHIDEKKGTHIKVLDVRGLSSITDYFIIATGTSSRHVYSLAEAAEVELKKMGGTIRHKEGHRVGDWIILDCSDFVVHIFQQETRDFYGLERLWNDAKPVELRLDTDGKSL